MRSQLPSAHRKVKNVNRLGVLLIVTGAGLAASAGASNLGDYLPSVRLERDSDGYVAFNAFVADLVRGQAGTASARATGEATQSQAERTARTFAQWIDRAFETPYTLESEVTGADGLRTHLSVSQNLRIDPVGHQSMFGSMVCPVRYTGTVTRTLAGWKVSAFTVEGINVQNCRSAR